MRAFLKGVYTFIVGSDEPLPPPTPHQQKVLDKYGKSIEEMSKHPKWIEAMQKARDKEDKSNDRRKGRGGSKSF